MIARLCMSDLHLGDGRSTLSNPEIADQVVAALEQASGGEIGTLILNGDVWEECVPAALSVLEDGLAKSTLDASNRFLGQLICRVKIGKIVVLAGNHDLSLWRWYNSSLKVKDPNLEISPYTGCPVNPSDWPWSKLLCYEGSGKAYDGQLIYSYPLYWDTSVGFDYPMLIFTHGHLHDPLVLGQDSEAEYVALKGLGCSRPSIPENLPSVGALARAVDSFVLSLWQRYSERDYVYANHVMRRLNHPQTCQWQNIYNGDGFHLTGSGESLDQPPPGQGYIGNVPAFLSLLIMDPALPSPVGTLGGKLGGKPLGPAFTNPSCLVFGHDHLGTRRMMAHWGVPWYVVDSGGWTSEYNGHLPHCHVLIWNKNEDVVPVSCFISARTKAGGVL
jgi:hypothetical protein